LTAKKKIPLFSTQISLEYIEYQMICKQQLLCLFIGETWMMFEKSLTFFIQFSEYKDKKNCWPTFEDTVFRTLWIRVSPLKVNNKVFALLSKTVLTIQLISQSKHWGESIIWYRIIFYTLSHEFGYFASNTQERNFQYSKEISHRKIPTKNLVSFDFNFSYSLLLQPWMIQ